MTLLLRVVMNYNSDIHHRRSIRLRGYDYAVAGAYFVTICTVERQCLFGEIAGAGISLNGFGTAVSESWRAITIHFPNVQLDEYVIMPNHFHAILHVIKSAGADVHVGAHVGAKQGSSASPGFGNNNDADKGEAGESFASPLRPHGTVSGSAGAVIQNFKSVSTRRINKISNNAGRQIWQRNYYEHVIRNEHDLENIRCYIADNPLEMGPRREQPGECGK